MKKNTEIQKLETIPLNKVKDLKKALETSNFNKVKELATTYDIKQVVFSESGEESTPLTLVIPNLNFKIKKWSLKILPKSDKDAEKIDDVLYNVLQDKICDSSVWVSQQCYLFLRNNPVEMITQEFKKRSNGIPLEALEVTLEYISALKEKINRKIQSQKKIVAYFISTDQMNPNYLLGQAVLNSNIELVQYLVKEQKADFKAHIKQQLPYTEKQVWSSPLMDLVEHPFDRFLIKKELFGVLLQRGFNPETRYAFHAKEGLTIPWIPFTTILALKKNEYPNNELYDNLYEQTCRHVTISEKKLAIYTGMRRSVSSLFKFKNDTIFDEKLLPLIFTFVDLGADLKIDFTPLKRFIPNNYTLLSQEIESYHRKVRWLFYLGLHAKNAQCSLQTLRKDNQLKSPYTKPLFLIFEFTGINRSAHFNVVDEMKALDQRRSPTNFGFS